MLEIARGMLDGSVDLIEGCRNLTAFHADASLPQSAAFDVLCGIESETDDYPIGEVRKSYSSELLERLDRDVAKYIDDARPAVLDACRQIIREIETATANPDSK
jgi:hypothetical protein